MKNSYFNETERDSFEIKIYLCDQDLDSSCEDHSKSDFILKNIVWNSFVAEGKAELADDDNYGKKPVHYLNRFVN